MIEYYIDGSTKDHMIGVGIVKVNEFGFIEKHHFNVEILTLLPIWQRSMLWKKHLN